MGMFEKVKALLPKELARAGSDYVSWISEDEKGRKMDRDKGYACYAGIMTRLPEMEIQCRPFPRHEGGIYGKTPAQAAANEQDPQGRLAGRLSPLQYARFTRGAFRTGIFPKGVKVFHDPQYGNCLTLPRKGWDRHTIYTILVLYRWIDCFPDNMWAVLLIQEDFRKRGIFLPFLQCLHYVISCNSQYNGGHSFLFLSNGHYCNPALGWAWAKFNSMTMEERSLLDSKGEIRRMYTTLAETINPQAQKDQSAWYFGKPQFKVASVEGLLDPRLSPLYTRPADFGPEEFRNLMEGISNASAALQPPASDPPAADNFFGNEGG